MISVVYLFPKIAEFCVIGGEILKIAQGLNKFSEILSLLNNSRSKSIGFLSNACYLFLVSLFFCSSLLPLHAQNQAFSFLHLPTHARANALGGVNVSLTGQDVSMFLNNPALLDSAENNQLSINYLPYFAGIKYSSAAYVRNIKGGTWGASVQYLNYGEFEMTDPAGNVLGTFRANDYALTLAHARKAGNISMGINLKLVGSTIETYQASAVLIDIGGVFKHPKHDLSIGLVIKNVGVRMKNFTPFDEPDLPFDVQAGGTFKPQYMPLRFSITAHSLYRFDIVYQDPKSPKKYDLNGNPIEERIGTLNKLARHFVFGTEVLLNPNFRLHLGYHFRRQQELRQLPLSSGAGFSTGFLLKLKAFELQYAYSIYHLSGSLSNFTLVCNLNKIMR